MVDGSATVAYAPNDELGSLEHIPTELTVCRNATALSCFPGKKEPFYRDNCAASAFRFACGDCTPTSASPEALELAFPTSSTDAFVASSEPRTFP